MSVYAVDKLMAETRRLAAEYYRATQQTLPVSGELAKYDAGQLLGLNYPENIEAGVDALDKHGLRIQIKSRVIFKEHYGGYRIGQFNMEGAWGKLVLLLMSDDYQPFEIYEVSRDEIEASINSQQNPNRQKRGAMSVAKFIALGRLVWTSDQGLETDTDYV